MGGARWGFLAAVVLFPSSVDARLVIEAFAPDLGPSDADDAVWIRNTGDSGEPLEHVVLSDGEGTWTFPAGLSVGPDETISIAADGTLFRDAAGQDADVEMDALPDGFRLHEGERGFQLAQDGDNLQLRRSGTLVDAVAYGDFEGGQGGWMGEPVAFGGRTFLRKLVRTGEIDHDDASDWQDLRRRFVGQDEFPPTRFTVASALAYTAPDRSREMVEAVIDLAQRSLRINVYEFRDLALARHIIERMAAHPNLTVDVLVDASPVGQERWEKSVAAHVAQQLVAAGARFHHFTHERYSFDHAKYVIVDSTIVLIQSENFVPSGIPDDRSSGNRGWGVLIQDGPLADALGRVFEADFRLRPHGAVNWSARDAPEFPEPVLPEDAHVRPATGTRTVQGVNATLLVTPGGALGSDDPILAALENATRSIRIEQLNFPPQWRTADGKLVPNHYLEAAKAAAARGVDVRILLDGHFVEDDDRIDNADTLLHLASEPAPTLHARLATAGRVLHVKGLVVDDAIALVGSMNWNLASPAQNREVGVLLEDPTIASLFAQSFDEDWRSQDPARTIPSPRAFEIVLIVCLLAVGTRRLRP